MPYRYVVGELCNPDVTSWPELPRIRITPRGIKLLLPYRGLTGYEIEQTGSRARFPGSVRSEGERSAGQARFVRGRNVAVRSGWPGLHHC